MKPKMPVFKKKVNAFLTSEEGKIAKESMLIAGGILAAVAASSVASKFTGASNYSKSTDCPIGDSTTAKSCYTHGNSADVTQDAGKAISVQHNHHYNHTSHASHSNAPPPDCCFPAGTMIATPKGDVNIKDVKKGDIVSAYDLRNGKIVSTAVLEMESPVREGVFKLNNDLISVTNEHPFYTKKKNGKICWASIDKAAAVKHSPKLKNINALELGDSIFHSTKGWIELKSMKFIKKEIKTYNLKEVKGYNNFFANGILVHNKGGWC
jgi:hypothetical protein